MVDTLGTGDNTRYTNIENGKRGDNLNMHWDKDVVFGYLREIKRFASPSSKTTQTQNGNTGSTPKNLGRSFMTIIGEVDLLNADLCVYRRVMNQVKFQFVNGIEVLRRTLDMGTANDNRLIPSDLENDLQFKPTECFADKSTEIFGHICVGELDLATAELTTFHLMRECPFFILWHADLDEAMSFIEDTFRGLIDWMNGGSVDAGSPQNAIPSPNDLSLKAQLTLKVIRGYMLRNFRYKGTDRLESMKEVVDNSDCCEPEWLIATFDAVRKKRDVPKYVRGGRHVAEEDEHIYVDRALKMDDQNPFVRLALLDCIVDCLRDSRQSFTCGGVTFHTNSSQIMVFMKQSCRDILAEFPRSVKFHSRISDYFARFVTLRFFDISYAEECLNIAYELNPTFPLTTHRLGIFARMSKGALSASFEWFRKTEACEPYHYNAFLECVKNMIGHPQKYNTAQFIEDKLRTPGACSWTDAEILELLFYKGIAHFVRNEPEEALETWVPVAIQFQPHFRLIDLDQVCGFYQWDMDLISSDKLRLWIHNENLKEDQPPSRRVLVNRLYNLMTGKMIAEKPRCSFYPLQCASYFQDKRQTQVN